MMNCLMKDLKMIEKVNNAQLARIIENIFANSTGDLLTGTVSTMYQLGKNPSINERKMINMLSNLKSKQE